MNQQEEKIQYDLESKSKVFNTLAHVNVNEHTETKPTGSKALTYLTWAWAWSEIKARYPEASYEIVKNPDGLPYFSDPKCGIMVYTKVTIEEMTHEMWLPVMDGANNAMRFEPYEIKTRFGPKQVEAATMFDVNKTVMRCLTKNLAMFGLGLYIYAGEDLPEDTTEVKAQKEEEEKAAAERADLIKKIDTEVKKLTVKMDKEAKVSFAMNTIVPIIGQTNYKTVTDLEGLEKLLAKITEASKTA